VWAARQEKEREKEREKETDHQSFEPLVVGNMGAVCPRGKEVECVMAPPSAALGKGGEGGELGPS